MNKNDGSQSESKKGLELASATGEVTRNSTLPDVRRAREAADANAKAEARAPSRGIRPGAYSVISTVSAANSVITAKSAGSGYSVSSSQSPGLQLASGVDDTVTQAPASRARVRAPGAVSMAEPSTAESLESPLPPARPNQNGDLKMASVPDPQRRQRERDMPAPQNDDLMAGSHEYPQVDVESGDNDADDNIYTEKYYSVSNSQRSSKEYEKSQDFEKSQELRMAKSPSGINTLPTLEAMKVESESDLNLAVATAEKDSCWAFFKRSRCAQLGTFIGCFVIVALAVGLSLAFFNKSIEETPAAEEPFFDQLGPDLDGPVVRAEHGSSIALSGDGTRMAVADNRDVYLYDLDEASDGTVDWLLVATIQAPENATLGENTHRHDMVRTAVQIDLSKDGDFIAVGWPYSADANGLNPSVGRVEVYQDQGAGTWERLGNVIYGWSTSDFFGTAVSLSGNGGTVAVGAPGNNGHADVFLLNQGAWVKQGDFVSLDGSLLVGSVSIDQAGQTFAVGGHPVGASTAVVRIFRFTAGNWAELGTGIIGNFQDTAYLAALSADGNIVAVSNYYRGEAGPAEGELNDALDVRSFEWDGNRWEQMGENLHGLAPGEKSGYFITLSDDGKLMGMGDPGRENEGGGVTGHAHIYQFDDAAGLWVQRGPNRYGESPGDQFGFAVALSGDGSKFAAGAPFNRGEGVERGRVSVFSIDL